MNKQKKKTTRKEIFIGLFYCVNKSFVIQLLEINNETKNLFTYTLKRNIFFYCFPSTISFDLINIISTSLIISNLKKKLSINLLVKFPQFGKCFSALIQTVNIYLAFTHSLFQIDQLQYAPCQVQNWLQCESPVFLKN